MKTAVKAGNLSIGQEKIVHAINTNRDLFFQKALCGVRPASKWTEVQKEITCQKCLIKKEDLK